MTKPKLPKGPITAEELGRLKEEMLRNDPKYRKRVKAVEAEREARTAKLTDAERPIVADLSRAGVEVSSVWDLVSRSEPYPEALPVLVRHLQRGGYPSSVMESLGRALAVKPAVAWWPQLKELYLEARSGGEAEGTAVAVAACATKAQLDDLIGFLGAKRRGETRIYFVRPIMRLGGAAGRDLLESLRGDPTLGKEISAALAGQHPNQ